jgi:hypothetical protein
MTHPVWRRVFGLILVTIALSLCGCASFAPLPGGADDVNIDDYKTPDDLMARLSTMRPGMTEQNVFARLGHNPQDLTRLQRNEILTALYGSNAVEFRNGQIGADAQSQFLQSLYGYSLKFRKVEKHIGFTSPWRLRTNENGYDYTVTFVFQNGVLYQSPIVAGGLVKKSSSKTLFDYLNPAAMVHVVN